MPVGVFELRSFGFLGQRAVFSVSCVISLKRGIVFVGDLEKLGDAGAFKIRGATASALKMATHGAGDTILVYLAYVHEEVTGLGAAVIPLLKELGNLRVMGSEAS